MCSYKVFLLPILIAVTYRTVLTDAYPSSAPQVIRRPLYYINNKAHYLTPEEENQLKLKHSHKFSPAEIPSRSDDLTVMTAEYKVIDRNTQPETLPKSRTTKPELDQNSVLIYDKSRGGTYRFVADPEKQHLIEDVDPSEMAFPTEIKNKEPVDTEPALVKVPFINAGKEGLPESVLTATQDPPVKEPVTVKYQYTRIPVWKYFTNEAMNFGSLIRRNLPEGLWERLHTVYRTAVNFFKGSRVLK